MILTSKILYRAFKNVSLRCRNKLIMQNDLPKLDKWLLDIWNPHIIRFKLSLVCTKNLYNEIKGNASRQRTVLPVTFNKTTTVALPGCWFNIQFYPPPPPPPPHTHTHTHTSSQTCMFCSRAFDCWVCKTWPPPVFSKRINNNHFSICNCNNFLKFLFGLIMEPHWREFQSAMRIWWLLTNSHLIHP